jgi:hypothetical protein
MILKYQFRLQYSIMEFWGIVSLKDIYLVNSTESSFANLAYDGVFISVHLQKMQNMKLSFLNSII